MDLDVITLLEHKQILSPQQIESLNILAMDWQEFADFLSREQEENPLQKPLDTPIPRTVRCNVEDDTTIDVPDISQETPREILLDQLNLGRYSQVEVGAFTLIADWVDESGFLTATLDELSRLSGFALDLLEKCLATMQTLEPTGVCARSLEECLSIQLRATGNDDELLHRIVMEHLRDIADGKITHIARTLDTSTLHVRRCIQEIRTLSPRPLNGLVGERARHVIPDIVLTYTNGSWEAALNDDWFEKLEICDYYATVAQATSDPELQEYFKEKIGRIRFLNAAIEKRRKTLVAMACRVAYYQTNCLLRGGCPAVLTMNRIAEDLGINASTISRAADKKYVQSPAGIREMRSLFVTGPCPAPSDSNEGAAVSREGVKARLKEILDSENKANPHSDNAIVSLFKKRGINLSRRVVAKYREELGIKGMHDRRYV